MEEKQQIIVVVIAALVIAIVAVAGVLTFTLSAGGGPLVVDTYTAEWQHDGTLAEKYVYEVANTGQYRFLFRAWDAPLVIAPIGSPSVEVTSVTPEEGTIGYAVASDGRVTWYGDTPTTPSDITTIASLGENEVGMYTPAYFAAGTHTASYTFIVHPPVEYDDDVAHLNLQLASSHVPYRQVTITLPDTYVQDIWVRPASMTVEQTGGEYRITGSAGEDELIEVEMLLDPAFLDEIDGFPTKMDDVRGRTERANFLYDLPLLFAGVLRIAAMVLVLAVPVLLYRTYRTHGTEKDASVPEHLSFVPDPNLKPWTVNLIFRGDAVDFDENGFYATLLDLHRRKVIEIKNSGEGGSYTITVLEKTSDDGYEQRVLNFLWNAGTDGVLDTGAFTGLAEQAKHGSFGSEQKVLSLQTSVAALTTSVDTSVVSQYLEEGRTRLVPIALFGGFVVLLLLGAHFWVAASVAALAGFTLRGLAIHRGLALPTYKSGGE